MGAYQENMELLGKLDIPGGGQVVVSGEYAFIGHMRPPHGTSIIDVSDPSSPKVVAHIAPPSPYSHTHKVRVVGDLLYANVERDRRHFFRKGEGLEKAESDLTNDLGRRPTETEIAERIGVAPEDMNDLRAGLARGYDEGGFRIFDISNRADPRLIKYVKTGGVGVHRFDVDENYAYISTEMDGYRGNILVIYDVSDPTNPTEVSRWWLPGQHIAGGEVPTWQGSRFRLHHALRQGDRLYAACWYNGGYVIDISDITRPKTVGHFDYHPPMREPTHTFFKAPQKIAGYDIALLVDEEHDGYVRGQPHGLIWIVDVSDVNNIKPLATFDVSEMDSPYSRAGLRFGAHQFQEHLSGTTIYAAWFSGGVRAIDISNPTLPREVGCYVPEAPEGYSAPQCNDVDVDERGLIHVLDRNLGYHILRHIR
jgi:hypothetical protein